MNYDDPCMQKRVGVEASETPPNGDNPMPKFVIERQYLVPMYQHIVVEAEHLETAYKRGISDDIGWDTQKMDCDGARKTTITNAKVIPDTMKLVAGDIITGGDVVSYGLSAFLYENEAETGLLLEIPDQFTDNE